MVPFLYGVDVHNIFLMKSQHIRVLFYKRIQCNSLITNSGFVHKIVANKGTELIQNIYLELENWLLIKQCC